MTEKQLRNEIIAAMLVQGFKINPHLRPAEYSKEAFRKYQQNARLEQIGLHKKFLQDNIELAKRYCRDGKEIRPENIALELIEVRSDSIEERLFRWWNLIWWSIPYQRSYGRQMRFILWDTFHDAPFGLICLQSPILKMSVRDKYLGIPNDQLDIWINRSLNAQRVGALPPYNDLLGGKMVALSLSCNELRKAYKVKYARCKSIIKNRKISSDLLFITTTSAFGKSSLYNRLKYHGDVVAECLGYTQGSGSFHVPEHIYEEIILLLEKHERPIGRSYGHGPSRKLKLISQGFRLLNLPQFEFHDIKREFYLFSFVKNLYEIIHKRVKPIWHDRSFSDLAEFWKERWALPRMNTNNKWQAFKKDDFFDIRGSLWEN